MPPSYQCSQGSVASGHPNVKLKSDKACKRGEKRSKRLFSKPTPSRRESYERGPIFDFKEFNLTGGKVWATEGSLVASGVLIPKINSKRIPSDLMLGGQPASRIFSKAPCTLLGVSYTAFSDSALESFSSDAVVVPVDLPRLLIRPIANPLKWLLWSQLIPVSPSKFILRGDLPGASDVFACRNKLAAYVYLVDSEGLIRWQAAGPASSAELSSLSSAIVKLQSQ